MPPDTNKELTDAIVNKAMARVRDRQSRPTEQVDAVKQARELDGWAILAISPNSGLPDDVAVFDRPRRVDTLLKTLADEVERREKLVALAVRWRAERLRYQTDPTVTNRAYSEAADALAMEIENYA